jgi:choline dehydrogenase-like flavoprotein
VITGAQVTRILFDGRRANGVEYLQGDGSRDSLQVRGEVLLSAGALQSPQILMTSRASAPARTCSSTACAVLHDLPGVGMHLHDHVDVVQVVDTPDSTESFGLSLPAAWRTLGDIFEWRRQRTGMLTTNFAEAGGFFRSQPGEPVPDIQLHFVIGKLVDHGRKTVFGHGYSCHVCLLHPQQPRQRDPGQRRPAGTAAHRPGLPGRPRRPGAHGARLPAHAADPGAAGTGGAGRPRIAGIRGRPDRGTDRRLHPPARRHHLPPGGQLPHGPRPAGRGGRRVAGARPAGAACDRRVDHAAHRRRATPMPTDVQTPRAIPRRLWPART